MSDRKTRPDVEAALREIMDAVELHKQASTAMTTKVVSSIDTGKIRATLDKLVRDAVEAERLWVEQEIGESLHALRLVYHPPEFDSDGRAFTDGAIHNLILLRRKIRARAGGENASA